MHLKNGTLLKDGTYRIERFISNGGFGCTYEAYHIFSGRKLAIKEFFINDFCNRDENSLSVVVGTQSKKTLVERLKKKFVDEAKSIWNLNHEGIVRVSDVFAENNTAYYVMDYIEGKSLDKIIAEKGRLSELEMLGYISQVARTLDYVHSKNILHLDIKPSNIMIDAQNKAILIDFGSSKQYDEIDGENTSTLLGKTPGYAPLEQMDNEVSVFYPATDIYALGATIYKMLTGTTPPNAIKRAAGTAMKPLPDDVSASTKNAVEFSMRLKKENRPQTIDEFMECLIVRNHDNNNNSNGNNNNNNDDVTILAKEEFDTLFSRYCATQRYEDAFVVCLQYMQTTMDNDYVRKKAKTIVSKVKGNFIVPVKGITYEWLIDQLVAKGFSDMKFKNNSLRWKSSIIKLETNRKTTSIIVKRRSLFIRMVLFLVLAFASFMLGGAVGVYIISPDPTASAFVFLFLFLIFYIVRSNIINKQHRKLISQMTDILFEHMSLHK